MEFLKERFIVTIPTPFHGPWPNWFSNFYCYCELTAEQNNWLVDTVANYQLKPHGRLIKTKTQGWYLRWNDEKYHTMFILRWS